jgi:hypothetical protein
MSACYTDRTSLRPGEAFVTRITLNLLKRFGAI